MDALQLREQRDGVSFQVRVRPASSRDAVGEVLQGALKVHLTAPPVEGAANRALLRLLAGRLGVSRSRLTLRLGAAAKNKVVEVEGMDDDALRAALGG